MSKEQVARDFNRCGRVKLAWSTACIFGCAYVVFWRGASGWWFLLAIVLAGGVQCRVRDDDTGDVFTSKP